MFTVDKMSRTPLYEQLIDQFESCILSGDIGPDGQLPSVRFLSQSLNINPNTLQRAFYEIEHRGLCYSVPGNGRFISKDALEKLRSNAIRQTEQLENELVSLKERGVPREAVYKIIEKVYGGKDPAADKEENE